MFALYDCATALQRKADQRAASLNAAGARLDRTMKLCEIAMLELTGMRHQVNAVPSVRTCEHRRSTAKLTRLGVTRAS